MKTLYCTENELANNIAELQALAIIELGAETAVALTRWPQDRTADRRRAWAQRAEREVQQAIQATLDWAWS